VEGIDGKSASVLVKITAKGAKVLQQPKGTFLEIITGKPGGTEF